MGEEKIWTLQQKCFENLIFRFFFFVDWRELFAFKFSSRFTLVFMIAFNIMPRMMKLRETRLWIGFSFEFLLKFPTSCWANQFIYVANGDSLFASTSAACFLVDFIFIPLFFVSVNNKLRLRFGDGLSFSSSTCAPFITMMNVMWSLDMPQKWNKTTSAARIFPTLFLPFSASHPTSFQAEAAVLATHRRSFYVIHTWNLMPASSGGGK